MFVSSYDLFIDLDFQGLKYKGTLGIELRTERDVVLDSVGLKIERVYSKGADFGFGFDNAKLTIYTGPFDGLLSIQYSGRIPDSLAGIYRAPYDHTHIVTTHFEAAQARRMFPCLDEPDAKAVFKLSVRIDGDLEAISNMPVQSQREDGDKKIVAFEPTPRMSTYLLYLGVGRFQTRTCKAGETEIIVATTPGKAELGAFAEQETRSALEFFNAYFQIPYALPKVHLIAVPEFPMGAMENWGAITFREMRLLVDENTSAMNKMRAAMSIVHELAHQWFGDLVTMKWWDDIWLNESFATFMSYKAVDHLHPEWKIWDNFFNGEPRSETQAGAMERDALRNTHPIQVQVDSPAEIEQIFDEISYGKGAQVLRMITTYVGEESFREGVHRYLSQHAYSNATSNDLWFAIEGASGKPVKSIMSTWLRQPGFPQVTAHLENGNLRLHQSRMLISGNPETNTWPVPMIVEVNGDKRTVLMESPELGIEAGDLKTLRINPERTGFFAVNISSVADPVWAAELSPIDRWGLVFDAFQFLLSGALDFVEYQSVLRRFEHEDDPLPAQEITGQLAILYALSPTRIMPISGELNHALLETLGNKSDARSSILRDTVASNLALIDQNYANALAREFKGYWSVAPDMRLAVATAYAKSTNDIDALMAAYGKSTSDEDKIKILRSMTVFSDESLIERSLSFALSSEVKRQDKIDVLQRASENPYVRVTVWNWLKDNLGKLQELYEGTGLLSLKLSSIIPLLCLGRVSEAESFFAEHTTPDAETGIKVGLEMLHAYDRLAEEISRHA